MTGICYFSDKSTDYFAEMQVKAIAKNEESIALKESGNFSPEKADKLLNEAIIKDCDKIVFLTEDTKVDTLSRLIPQEYGQYFEDIQVIAENFYRIRENDGAAQAAPAQTTQTQTTQQTQTSQPQQQQQQQQTTQGAQVVIVCDAAIPTSNALKAMMAEMQAQTTLIKSGNYNQYNVAQNAVPVLQFCDVESAGLSASGIHTLYQKHPALSQGYANAKVSKGGFDANIQALEACAMTEDFVKGGGTKVYVLPKGVSVQAKGQNVVFVEGSNVYSDSGLNQNALGMIVQLIKDTSDKKKDVPTRSDYKDDDKSKEEFAKDQKKIEYITTYMKCYEWWTKNRDKRMKTEDASNELGKAIAKWLASDVINAWNGAKNGDDGAAAKFIANGISSIYQASKKKQATDNKNENAKSEDEKLAIKVFKHKSYRDLCKVLGLQS